MSFQPQYTPLVPAELRCGRSELLLPAPLFAQSLRAGARLGTSRHAPRENSIH